MTEPKGGTGTKPRTAKKTGGRKAAKTKPRGKAGNGKAKGGKKATGQLSKPPMQQMSEQDIILASLTDEQRNAIVREYKLKTIFGYFKKDIEDLGCKVGNVIILDAGGVLYDPDTYNIEPETDDDADDDDGEHDGDIDDDADDVTIALEEWMDTYDKTQTWVAKKVGVQPATVNHWLRDENPTYPRPATEKKVRKLIATAPKRRGRPRKKR